MRNIQPIFRAIFALKMTINDKIQQRKINKTTNITARDWKILRQSRIESIASEVNIANPIKRSKNTVDIAFAESPDAFEMS